MIKKTQILLPVMALGLMTSACQKIETQDMAGQPLDFGATMDNIPLDYGRLVSAVPVTQHVDVLWFERDDGTIVGVRVNVSRGTISKEAIRIERR